MLDALSSKLRDAEVRIGPVTVVGVDADTAVALVIDAVRRRTASIFAFCNMHTFNLAARDPAYAQALAQAVVFNDGIGMDIAGKLLFGRGFPANLNGTDLTPQVLAALPADTGVFLLGSAPGVAEQAGDAFTRRYPQLHIAGVQHGFFSDDEGAAIAARVRATGAGLVLVGMGNPAQELWAARHGQASGAVMMCIGAFLDFSAGKFTRAPRLVRALRLEWVYRLLLEPRRMFGRYIGGAVPFLATVLRERRR